jgi:hypothetical protein
MILSTDPRLAAVHEQSVLLDRFIHQTTATHLGVQEHEPYVPDRFDIVDPLDRLRGPDGKLWGLLGILNAEGDRKEATAITSEQDLTFARETSRELVNGNEFAINGTENRISYVVGTGHTYTATLEDDNPDADVNTDRVEPAKAKLEGQAQDVIDEFVKRNRWHSRQQEIVRRRDRDGEAFLRFFRTTEGIAVRFVEPGSVTTPTEQQTNPNAKWGILTDEKDVETVIAYYVDGEAVDPAEIQHRKANVDANVKRGIPTWWPVSSNLRRAEKLLRNMTTVAEIQSAFALIRRHTSSSADVEQFVKDTADRSTGQTLSSGRTVYNRTYRPGTILDAYAGTDYDFPTSGIDAGRYVIVLQAELRAVASRLVMPEFMLSSDASNANYSSTLVAEGPAVKMFERLQWDMIQFDLEILEMEIEFWIAAGRLPEEARDLTISATPPNVATRDRLKDTQADGILVDKRAMSRHTMRERHDLDPDLEKQRIEEEREQDHPFLQMRAAGIMPGQTGDDDGQDRDRNRNP